MIYAPLGDHRRDAFTHSVDDVLQLEDVIYALQEWLSCMFRFPGMLS